MNPSLNLRTFLLAIVASLLAGCSDPADKVAKAKASDPQKTSLPSSSAGKEFVLRAESKIGFVGSKVTGSHHGGFKKFAGKFTLADGKMVGTPEFRIAMASTWADNEKLEDHLKSPDFFDVAKYPVTTFTITAIEPAGPDYRATGNFTLHGVTKSISFPAKIQLVADAVTVVAEFAINRKDFNVNFPGMPNDLIRDHVVIQLDLKATPGAARPEETL